MKKIKQRGGLYSPKNVDSAMALASLIQTLEKTDLKKEAQVLKNLKIARSNYLHALAAKSQGKNYRIGGYTRSFRAAKKEARTLYQEFMACPTSNIFLNPSIIKSYLQTECSCIT
tara:strand:- start:235303 stop:235647 length:345 start_codon:yes stop_codon:yes gene_type:complete